MRRLVIGLLALVFTPALISCSAVGGENGDEIAEINQPGIYVVPVRIGGLLAESAP